MTNPNQALWEKGDFTEIAAFMRRSGEALVESLRVRPPVRVLDLGCGDGTTAVPLARTGADVLGVDIARIVERFGRAGVARERITMTRDTYSFITPAQPARFIETFGRYYGPTMNALEAAEKSGRVEDLRRRLLDLARAQNKATDGSTSIPATFLRVSVSL